MKFGVCYYPEHYDSAERKARMLEDISMMKEMKMNIVRIGEFAWCEMEPNEGEYRFEWLDEIIDLLGQNGIFSILCTPTAAPPIWLGYDYPDTRYINENGTRRNYGARRYSCYNSEKYRQKSIEIVERMAKRYGNNPYIMGFQIDNELGIEDNARCCCPHCAELFVSFLKKKYNTVENLNKSWGTIFWGQKYQSFEQIKPPYATTFKPNNYDAYMGVDNPSLRMDFERFCSDSIIDYCNMQIEILKKYSDKPITTNSTALWPSCIEYNKMYKKADVFSVDAYTDINSSDRNAASYIYAFSRGMLGGGFWVLETYCGGGHGNWARTGIAQGRPGAYRNNVLLAYACGATAVTVFKLHGFRWGFEQLGSSLIDLDRVKRRRFYEFKETGELIEKLSPIIDRTEIKSDIAIVFDYESLWSMRIKPISGEFDYIAYSMQVYTNIRKYGANVDIVTPDKDISGYKVVVLPCLTMVKPEYAQRLKNFAKNGGVVIGTFLTASKDENCNGFGKSMPVDMTDLFGALVCEQDYLPNVPCPYSVEIAGESFACKAWAETLEPSTAEAYSRYSGGFKDGLFAVTENKYYDGKAYYVGCYFGEDALCKFFGDVLPKCGIKRFSVGVDNRVEIIKRSGSDKQYYVMINNSVETVKLEYSGDGRDILSGDSVEKSISLEPMQICVIEENKA